MHKTYVWWICYLHMRIRRSKCISILVLIVMLLTLCNDQQHKTTPRRLNPYKSILEKKTLFIFWIFLIIASGVTSMHDVLVTGECHFFSFFLFFFVFIIYLFIYYYFFFVNLYLSTDVRTFMLIAMEQTDCETNGWDTKIIIWSFHDGRDTNTKPMVKFVPIFEWQPSKRGKPYCVFI